MTKGILGRKVGMTQIYDESGIAIPVTVIEAGPCHVLQIRTEQCDGYEGWFFHLLFIAGGDLTEESPIELLVAISLDLEKYPRTFPIFASEKPVNAFLSSLDRYAVKCGVTLQIQIQ